MAYGRIIQVTIGPPGSGGVTPTGTIASQSQIIPASNNPQGQLITDLHMSFKVKKSIGMGAAVPTCELKIYNMSLKSYFTFVKINYACLISVGYQDESVGAMQQIVTGPSGGQSEQTVGVPLQLFSGSIRFCRRYREGPDMIVYIEADGGMWQIGGAYYSVNYQPGIDVYSILQNLSSSGPNGMKVPILGLSTVKQFNVVYSSGFSFSGTVRDLVYELCDLIGFNAIISGGEIRLVPPLSVYSSNPATGGSSVPTASPGMLISKETGLLQPPQPEQISIGIPSQSSDVNGGSQSLPTARWKIDALLLPQVGPGDVMQVKSDNFPSGSAFMLVEEIEYTGDNRKDDWKMEARCIPVDASGNQTTISSPYYQGAPA